MDEFINVFVGNLGAAYSIRPEIRKASLEFPCLCSSCRQYAPAEPGMQGASAGDDIELHFFPAAALQRHHNASFAAWVLNHGVKLTG